MLNVWKRVKRYARDGFTAVIHGKYTHEESRATASQVTRHDGGRYLMVRDMSEAEIVCDFIARRSARLSAAEFREHFRDKATPGFDPSKDLDKVGVANQTTMLANESYVDAPKWASPDSEPSRWQPGQVLSYVRPLDAALVGRGPVWCS